MWFRKERTEERLDAELRDHFERLVHELVTSGVQPEEARRQARLEFGDLEQIKEDCRDVSGRWLEDFGKDLRYSARTLRRNPGFLAVSVLSLALGIGANAAIFNLIHSVMMRSLPVHDPERLIQISRISTDNKQASVSYALFKYLEGSMKSISGSAVQMESSPTIVLDGAEELVDAELVSGSHYSVLGIQPSAGRLLEPADDAIAPSVPAAVISYNYWHRRFGLSPTAIGKTFTFQIRNQVFTIVGVTPPGYQGARLGRDPDITMPVSMILTEKQRQQVSYNGFEMLARLVPGASIGQADAEFQVSWQAFLQRAASSMPENDHARFLQQRAVVTSGANGLDIRGLRSDYGQALLVLMAIVALVLLLACANLSGLLLARAASRQREISVRMAIGANSGRLIRQFLTESFLLALLGGCAGLLLARWVSNALVAMMADRGETLVFSAAIDWPVLGFTGAISFAACILCGLAPATQVFRANLNPGLKQTKALGRPRLGQIMVTIQVAISMLLVVGAALFVGTLTKLYSVDRGLRTDGILTFGLRTSDRYPPNRRWTSLGTLLDRLNALRGVSSASAVDVLPISGSLWNREIQVEGYTFRPDESVIVGFNAIAPKYFATLATPVLSGREFDDRDTNKSSKVAVVNESFAQYFFRGQSPLGRRVTSGNATYQIVGVVKDAKYQDLRQDAIRTMYIPLMQIENYQASICNFVVRVSAGDPMRLAPLLEKLIRDTDAGWRLRSIQKYSTVLDRTMRMERIMAILGGFFGVLALLIASVGIFGVIMFQVSRRVGEIGLRIALGASRSGILALILRDVVWMLVAGIVIGSSVAITLTGLTSKILFGITPADPAVFGLAAIVLAVAAMAAAWLPARRAMRVDPVAALRQE